MISGIFTQYISYLSFLAGFNIVHLNSIG